MVNALISIDRVRKERSVNANFTSWSVTVECAGESRDARKCYLFESDMIIKIVAEACSYLSCPAIQFSQVEYTESLII